MHESREATQGDKKKEDCRLFIQQIRSDLSEFLSSDSSAYTVNLKRDVNDVTPVWWHVCVVVVFLLVFLNKIETANESNQWPTGV